MASSEVDSSIFVGQQNGVIRGILIDSLRLPLLISGNGFGL